MAAERIAGLLDALARWRGEHLDLVERVDLDTDQIAIGLNLSLLTDTPGIGIRHVVPTQIRRRGVEMRLVLEGTTKPDPALIKALVRAHRWFDDLVAGRARSIGDIARATGVSSRYVGQLMPLAFLAPDIVEAILAGTQPAALTAETFIKHTDLPLGWADQTALLGFE